ncbi:MAG: molybdenum cofactor biosysynthesis protein [Microbacteriaceae bacterium]|nr:molybdenum cofactor biosysynthesis protein [Microbacteriaceae bacterium]
MTAPSARVVSVSFDRAHRFSKPTAASITLIEGIGVEGDAHAGATVQHLHRLKNHADEPNLRQVHLIHSELFTELEGEGHGVEPGQLGENVTTEGIDLLGLPRGARLAIGDDAVIEITGLRNPCTQINRFQTGLMKAVLGRNENGDVVRKTGVMSVVVRGGVVRAGDAIVVTPPAGEQSALEVV